MNESILIVDDEIQILKSLSRVLFSAGFMVRTAESGEEALRLLGEKRADLMITDIKMPGMDGYQLLKAVKEQYPSVIRMALSGYYNETSLLKIQQNSLAKLHLFKPWSNQELIKNIESILKTEQTLKDKRLFEVINKIDFLPSPDEIYQKFSQLIEQDAGMHEIAAVIESDQATAAKVIQIANSAFYGTKTGSVRKVLTYLGLANVKNILLNININNMKNHIKKKDIYNDFLTVSDHTAMTNKILNHLYQKILGTKIRETCMTAGLLHDVGKIIILSMFSAEYSNTIGKINKQDNIYHYFEEVECLEVSHSEIGAYLLSWWEMPYPIIESALYHHTPLDDRVINKELVSLVYVADNFSWSIISKQMVKLNPDVLQLLNLSEKDVSGLFEDLSRTNLF